MKKLLLVLALVVPTLGLAQKKTIELRDTISKVDGEYQIINVVSLDSTYHKDKLYRSAKSFFANAFRSANNVIQYDDREEGRIIGKGNITTSSIRSGFMTSVFFTWTIKFSIQVDVKDAKYRCKFYDFVIDQKAQGISMSGNNIDNSTLTMDMANYMAKNKSKNQERFIDLINQTLEQFKNLQSSLDIQMKKSSTSKGDDF